jgi:hypothetical protein
MNDGRNELSVESAILRRFRGIALLLVFVIGLPVLLFWLAAPTYDPRLFGEWRSPRGMIWRFHPDGRLERITAQPPSGPAPWAVAPWRTEGDELFIGGQQTPVMQILRWLDRRSGARRSFSRPVFQIVEVTDSTLRLRRTVPTPPGPLAHTIAAEEVLTRGSATKN